MHKYSMGTGIVYIWRDRKHGRYYVGCHWGTPDDGYVCSSNWMKQAYKIRPGDFKRRILAVKATKAEMFDEEHRWLKMMKEDELKGKRYYNFHNRHHSHWVSTSTADEVRRKMSESAKKRWAKIRPPGWVNPRSIKKPRVLKPPKPPKPVKVAKPVKQPRVFQSYHEMVSTLPREWDGKL